MLGSLPVSSSAPSPHLDNLSDAATYRPSVKMHSRGLGFVLAASACGRAQREGVSAVQASLGLLPGHTVRSFRHRRGQVSVLYRALLGSEAQRLVERLQGDGSLLRTVCTGVAPGVHVSSGDQNPHGSVVALNA